MLYNEWQFLQKFMDSLLWVAILQIPCFYEVGLNEDVIIKQTLFCI